CWVAEHAHDLGIDTSRIAVGGTSAGACLATAVTLYSRDHHGPPVSFQALDIPVVDNELTTPSMRAFTDTPLWTLHNAKLSWQAYLGPDRGAAIAAYAAPARATDLAGLPPAYISVCEFDPLRDEGIDYARRLVDAGVPTELHLYPGTFHGSAHALAHTDISARMLSELVESIRIAGRPTAGVPEEHQP
ncbi:MAG: alpha/beta hydrolase fold domain-containing protein, partial [Stackebrandtia sp.]